jgi:hypothetical protein
MRRVYYTTPGSLPGLHPDVFVQKPNPLSQDSDKHPSHDLSQLKPKLPRLHSVIKKTFTTATKL